MLSILSSCAIGKIPIIVDQRRNDWLPTNLDLERCCPKRKYCTGAPPPSSSPIRQIKAERRVGEEAGAKAVSNNKGSGDLEPVAPKPKKLQILQDPLDPVCAYLRDIWKTKLLTALEEVALSQKIQNAFEVRVEEGRLSKEKMVKSNYLLLVVSIAPDYQDRGVTFQDLIQVHIQEVISLVNKSKRALVMEHGRKPLDAEVSELVGLSVEKLQKIVKAARALNSMEWTRGEEGTTMVGESVADKGVESPADGIVKQLLKQDVERVLRALNP